MFQLFVGTMEDVEMASNVGKKLSHKEQKQKIYNAEEMQKWKRNKCNRNNRNKIRKAQTQEIERLKALDIGLHGCNN